MPISEVLRFPWTVRGRQSEIRQRLVYSIGILEDSNKAMQADGQMRQANRFINLQNHSSSHNIPWRVLAIRLIRSDVEFAEILRPRLQREGKLREEGSTCRRCRGGTGMCTHEECRSGEACDVRSLMPRVDRWPAKYLSHIGRKGH